jgi:glycosyltransferase involved in cell wall biosynthesis
LPNKALLLVSNYGSDVGYAWWLMEGFWAKLAEHYHRNYTVLLAYPKIKQLPPGIMNAPIRVVEQEFGGKRLGQVLRQCRFLRGHNVKVIYFSDQATMDWRYGFYRLFGVRLVVVHDHTPGLRTMPGKTKGALKRLAHRLPWFSADGAIGATEFVRQRLISINGLPPDRVYAAPNGLPAIVAASAKPDLHRLFQIPVERKIVVMTGRAHRYKGVDFALQCIARLHSVGRSNCHFLFMGDGPDLARFIASARRLGISDRCSFVGRRSDVPQLLQGADIAIHPSHGEVGYSLSILEYMRAGLPAVVPDNPSVCGATEHEVTGLVYPECDVQGASEALMRLLDDPSLCTRLGAQARIAVRHLTLEKTHSALLEAFHRIEQKRNNPWEEWH